MTGGSGTALRGEQTGDLHHQWQRDRRHDDGGLGVYASSGTVTIYGSVTASGHAHGLYATGGNVNVNNIATAPAVISAPSMTYNGIYNFGPAMITLTGCVLVYPNSLGTSNAPIYGSFSWTKTPFPDFAWPPIPAQPITPAPITAIRA